MPKLTVPAREDLYVQKSRGESPERLALRAGVLLLPPSTALVPEKCVSNALLPKGQNPQRPTMLVDAEIVSSSAFYSAALNRSHYVERCTLHTKITHA